MTARIHRLSLRGRLCSLRIKKRLCGTFAERSKKSGRENRSTPFRTACRPFGPAHRLATCIVTLPARLVIHLSIRYTPRALDNGVYQRQKVCVRDMHQRTPCLWVYTYGPATVRSQEEGPTGDTVSMLQGQAQGWQCAQQGELSLEHS